MIENQNLNPEEQANLHIVSNMDESNLPPFMQSVLSLAQTPAEKDMLLMATLTACGAVMPSLYCRYGIAAKRYYPNLQLFIVGSAAYGKGIANLALELVKPLDQKQILLSLLPDEFGHAILVKEAAAQGIPPRTAERWNENWQQQGIVYRVKHDCYKKIA